MRVAGERLMQLVPRPGELREDERAVLEAVSDFDRVREWELFYPHRLSEKLQLAGDPCALLVSFEFNDSPLVCS